MDRDRTATFVIRSEGARCQCAFLMHFKTIAGINMGNCMNCGRTKRSRHHDPSRFRGIVDPSTLRGEQRRALLQHQREALFPSQSHQAISTLDQSKRAMRRPAEGSLFATSL